MRGYHSYVAALCKSEGWPQPVAEYQFAAPRKWRFDLCWPDYWLAVEIQGGLFSQGAHVQGMHLRREYEKTNEAAIRGWVVLHVLPEHITDGTLTNWLKRYFVTGWPTRFERIRNHGNSSSARRSTASHATAGRR